MNEWARPAFILEEAKLLANLEKIHRVEVEASVAIIPALKSFALWHAFPLLKPYVSAAAASSLNEVLLIREEMGLKAHTYAPVFHPSEFPDILVNSSHIIFNSLEQFNRYAEQMNSSGAVCSAGLRINPEYSEVEVELYNPCAPGSRLGVILADLPAILPTGLDGLHVHALCDSDSYAFERLLNSFEKRFQAYFDQIRWVNFGGGHMITKPDYDIEHLISVLKAFKSRYNLEIYLEPGGAFVFGAGTLRATVLDIVENQGIKTAMLDVSFKAHMPDTLEMPYRPDVVGASEEKESIHRYRFGGLSCLSGDYVGDYVFAEPLRIGDQVVFEDMMQYTMVQTTMFNGVQHPDVCIQRENGILEVMKTFDYHDFKSRLG